MGWCPSCILAVSAPLQLLAQVVLVIQQSGWFPPPPGCAENRQPCWGTLLPGMALPLFQNRGTSPTVSCTACATAPASSHPLSARPEQGSSSREGDRDAFWHLFSATAPASPLAPLVWLWPAISPSPPRGQRHEEGSGHQQTLRKKGSPSFLPTSHSLCFLFPEMYLGVTTGFRLSKAVQGQGSSDPGAHV